MNEFNIFTIVIHKRHERFCAEVFYEDVNPIECITIEGINLEQINLKSRIEKYLIIRK